MYKKLCAFILILSVMGCKTYASEPYRNYTYSSDSKPYIEPQAYVPYGVIDGKSLGIDSFRNPSDVFAGQDGKIYIADTDNNRIVITDSSCRLIKIIREFDRNSVTDSFKKPQGIFVDEKNQIYIADTENKRVVQLDGEGRYIKEYQKPAIPIDTSDFDYKPIRVCVDKAGRLFIVSMNVNQGMIELDKEGNFISFFGATRVRQNFTDLLWKRILTQDQIDSGILSLPTEYSGNDIDGEGFVFGTISATGENGGLGSQTIRKLNPTGIDILRRTGFTDPMGDVNYVYKNGGLVTSKLVDVCIGDYGIYSVLDLQRGRVFTYDYDGSLLYVFGGLGEALGLFSFPKAVDKLPDGRFLVADSGLNHIVIFNPTDYAGMINAAVVFQYKRDYVKAESEWEKILKYTTNSDIAYIGMGKALLRQENYKEAMSFLKLGSNRSLYSKAFKEYRKEMFNDSFGLIMTWICAALLVFLVVKTFKKFRKYRKGGVKHGNFE